MPTVWLVKDGPQSQRNRTKKLKELAFAELDELLRDYDFEFLQKTPPAINTATPSEHYEHVVIELKESEGPSSRFPNGGGFYRVEDLTPAEASRLFNSLKSQRYEYKGSAKRPATD